MNGIFIIVVVATVALLLLVVYDKRNSILKFFREKVFKPKEIKLPKYEEKPKMDTDLIPDEGKLNYGDLQSTPQNAKQNQSPQTDNEDNIFGGVFEEDDDDIDLDQMFEELRQRAGSNRKFKSEMLDENVTLNFNDMSMDDLDDLIEDQFSKRRPSEANNYLPSGNLTGEELGKAIKNLPPEIKMILLNDILKKKF